MLLNHRTITPARPREMTTSQTRELRPQAADEFHESGVGDYLRPEPAPATFLDTATEPAPWAHETQPRPSRTGHPWWPGS